MIGPSVGARLYPKDQPQHAGLSHRVVWVPRRSAFGHVAATGLGGTVAPRAGGTPRPVRNRL